jgi:hypothetical protein
VGMEERGYKGGCGHQRPAPESMRSSL